MKHGFVALLCLFCLSACGTPQLKPGAEKVRMAKADPDPKCQEIGFIEGTADAVTGRQEGARNKARNEAFEKGANYLRLETIENGPYGVVRVSGTAFKCPN